MAINYKFPGVYASITDLSGVLNINATTSCAYVGQAEFGPVYQPILLTSLNDYNVRFGSLSSKYGYAGYSLAIAAETIPEHRFVRVVPRGNGPKDAKWASLPVLVKGAEVKNTDESESSQMGAGAKGYFYNEIISAEEERDAGLPVATIFTKSDIDTAMVITATDPNDRKFEISISDSTVNTNKSYQVKDLALSVDGETTTVVLKIETEFTKEAALGDPIVVKRMSNDKLNGVFTIGSIEYSKGYTTIAFVVDDVVESSIFENARVGRYPNNKETTFSLTVFERIDGSSITLETFPTCTLFAAKDGFGNSTFIEDVVNGSSNYIQVFVNTNFSDSDDYFIPEYIERQPLKNGRSGQWEDDAQMYQDIFEAWELFRDRAQVPASLLMNCGYVTKNNVTVQSKMLEIAEYRRDCFCLLDVPMTETQYEDLSDWRTDVQGFNTYRGAMCAPWVKGYDAAQGRANFVMCPSAYMAKIIGTNDPWIAPAGLNRGVLSASVVSPTGLTQYYNTIQGGILYADNQINCIIRDPGVGYVNWGQRTLQQKASAMDRINVARTIIYIETILRDAAKWHLFENNTTYERTQITLQFNSFLNNILSAEGIQRFVVKCDSENNPPSVIEQNQMVIDIYIWPTYCAEVIQLNTIVEGADVSVQLTSN